MLVGTDIDGVLCKELSKWQRSIVSRFPYKFLFYLFRYFKKAKVKNIHFDFVITGRPECDRKWTEKWLAKNHITYLKLYMAANPSIKDYRVKTAWVLSLGITDFIEDNVYTRFKLKRLKTVTVHNSISEFIKYRKENR